ncbi:MAG: hypothetical protein ACK55X_10860 [Synechococcaceae cyanobacterium]
MDVPRHGKHPQDMGSAENGLGRQHERFRLRVLQAKQAVIVSTAADVQKQGDVDAELLLEQSRHCIGLTQATGADGPAKTLPRVIRERREQLVQAMFLQCLTRRDATDSIEAELQASQAGAEPVSQVWHLNGLGEMQAEIAGGIPDYLPRVIATRRCRALDLLLIATCCVGRGVCSNHKIETRGTIHARSPATNLQDPATQAPLGGG